MPEGEKLQGNTIGCLLYRHRHGRLEVFLVQKTKQRWAIPELPVSDDEDFESAARAYVQQITAAQHVQVDLLGYVVYPKRRLNCYFSALSNNRQPDLQEIDASKTAFLSIDEASKVIDKRQQLLLGSLRATVMFRDTA